MIFFYQIQNLNYLKFTQNISAFKIILNDINSVSSIMQSSKILHLFIYQFYINIYSYIGLCLPYVMRKTSNPNIRSKKIHSNHVSNNNYFNESICNRLIDQKLFIITLDFLMLFYLRSIPEIINFFTHSKLPGFHYSDRIPLKPLFEC